VLSWLLLRQPFANGIILISGAVHQTSRPLLPDSPPLLFPRKLCWYAHLHWVGYHDVRRRISLKENLLLFLSVFRAKDASRLRSTRTPPSVESPISISLPAKVWL
jgi:hypothetical protein